MSTPGYWKGEIPDTYDWLASKFYTLDASSVNSLYFPRTTDIITLTPHGESIRCWTEWDNTAQNWKVYISDFSFVGKIYYRLRSRAY